MESNVIMKNNNLFVKVFLWMFLGLFATGFISVVSYQSGLVETFAMTGGFQVVAIIEIIVVIVFSLFFRKVPPLVTSILFFIYAAVNGFSMSVIFYCFELNSIIFIFFGAALIFALTAIFGYVTKYDLSKIWPLLLISLIIGVILTIINLLIGNKALDMVLSWIILIVFFGVTAYDIQKIKMLANTEEDSQKLHIYGAMELYLDFINIFIKLLNLFGKRK